MNVTCINKPNKFKNLTLNHQYPDVIEDGEVFVVTNDAGFRARYAKNYFRVNPETPVTRNLLDLLTVTFDEDDRLTIVLNRTTRTIRLNINQSEISCGIDEIEGISEVKRAVHEMYAAKVADIVGTKAEMFKKVLDTIFEELRDNDLVMCWLLSDQIKTTDTELDAVLTEMSDIHTTGLNPNSDHEIILWVIK